MQYKEYRDASDRLTVSLEKFPSIMYWWTAWRIARKFSLNKKDAINSVPEKLRSYASSQGEVAIDWDNWSGFTVTALDVNSEDLVLDIGRYLNDKWGE